MFSWTGPRKKRSSGEYKTIVRNLGTAEYSYHGLQLQHCWRLRAQSSSLTRAAGRCLWEWKDYLESSRIALTGMAWNMTVDEDAPEGNVPCCHV